MPSGKNATPSKFGKIIASTRKDTAEYEFPVAYAARIEISSSDARMLDRGVLGFENQKCGGLREVNSSRKRAEFVSSLGSVRLSTAPATNP